MAYVFGNRQLQRDEIKSKALEFETLCLSAQDLNHLILFQFEMAHEGKKNLRTVLNVCSFLL